MNKNKIAAVCAACVVLFGMAAAAEAMDGDYGILSYLGINIQSESYDKPVCRGEFTSAAVKLLNCDEISGGASPFWDVNDSNPYKSDISTAYYAGIVNGDSGEGFKAYENIKYIDALTELVRICGYEIIAERNGSYPYGYANTAGQLGIGISGTMLTDEITYREMYELLVQTLEADSYEDIFLQQYPFDDKTVLERYHNIKKAEGIVNADENACLLGYSVCGKNEIAVGDMYYSAQTEQDLSGMLGLFVRVYYVDTDEDKAIVQISAVDSKNRLIKIPSEELDGVSGGYLGYFENGRAKKVKIVPDASVIYNKRNIDYVKELNDKLFDIADGEVTLIDNGSGSYNVIKITEYKNITVKYADKENYVLYDKFSPEIIDIDPEKDSQVDLKISDSEGNTKQFGDIANEDVLTVEESRDGGYVRIIISKNIEKAVIKGIEEDDDNTVVTTENGSYSLTQSARSNPNIKLKTGEAAVLYINYEGRLAGISYDDTVHSGLAYLLYAYIDTNDELPVLKLLDRNGQISDIHTADKVIVNGTAVKKEYEKVFNSDMIYSIVAYETNKDGRINKLDTAEYDPVLEEDDSLFLRCRYEDIGELAYKSPDRTFNGRLSINEDTFMVEVPEEKSNYGDYRVLTYSDLTNTNLYKVDIYSFTSDSPLADAVVIYSMESTIKPKDNEFLSMVKRAYMSVNEEEDETCLTLDIQRGESTDTVYVTDEEIIPLLNGIGKGDIIRYGVNYKNEVTRFQWVYDYSDKKIMLEKNPTNTDYSSGSSRVIGAYVYMNDSGYIRIGNDMLNADDSSLETYLSSKVKQYVVDDTYEMKLIAQDEVRAYKDFGPKADYCIVQSYYGDIRTVIYIR